MPSILVGKYWHFLVTLIFLSLMTNNKLSSHPHLSFIEASVKITWQFFVFSLVIVRAFRSCILCSPPTVHLCCVFWRVSGPCGKVPFDQLCPLWFGLLVSIKQSFPDPSCKELILFSSKIFKVLSFYIWILFVCFVYVRERRWVCTCVCSCATMCQGLYMCVHMCGN